MSLPFDTSSGFRDEVFEDLDAAGQRLEEKEFEGCSFVACNLRGALLDRCRFISCAFRSCDLSLLGARGSSFRGVRFDDSKVVGVDWTQAETTLGFDVVFERSIVDDSSFMGLELEGLRMIECRARGVNFVGAQLRGADFAGTDLSESQFSDSDLGGADFANASNVSFDVRACRLNGTKVSLEAALGLLAHVGVRVPDLE